jgi:hypothetical protein
VIITHNSTFTEIQVSCVFEKTNSRKVLSVGARLHIRNVEFKDQFSCELNDYDVHYNIYIKTFV